MLGATAAVRSARGSSDTYSIYPQQTTTCGKSCVYRFPSFLPRSLHLARERRESPLKVPQFVKDGAKDGGNARGGRKGGLPETRLRPAAGKRQEHFVCTVFVTPLQ